MCKYTFSPVSMWDPIMHKQSQIVLGSVFIVGCKWHNEGSKHVALTIYDFVVYINKLLCRDWPLVYVYTLGGLFVEFLDVKSVVILFPLLLLSKRFPIKLFNWLNLSLPIWQKSCFFLKAWLHFRKCKTRRMNMQQELFESKRSKAEFTSAFFTKA